jgi:ubiquinone biosynthesis protein Coq4
LEPQVLVNNMSTLVMLLDGSGALPKRCALSLLQKLSPVGLLTALLGRITVHLDDEDADVRRGVVAVLAHVPTTTLDSYADALLSFVFHPSPSIRVTSLSALAYLSATWTQGHLPDILSTALMDLESSDVRWAALDLLQMNVHRFLIEKDCEGEVPDGGGFYSRQTGTVDPVHGQAETAEIKSTEDNGRDSINSWVLKNESILERGLAASDACNGEDGGVEKMLQEQATKAIRCFTDPDKYVRWKAVSVLSTYPSHLLLQDTLEHLLGCLNQPFPFARIAALMALSRLEEKAGLKKGDDMSVEEHTRAGESFWHFHGEARVVQAMSKRLWDEDYTVRVACLQSLRTVPPDVLGAALIDGMEEGDGDDCIVAKLASQLKGRNFPFSETDGDDGGHYVQQAAGQILETLYEVSSGSLVTEDMVQEVHQMRLRQEKESRGWDAS